MSRVVVWFANGLLFVFCCYLVAQIVREVTHVWLEEDPAVRVEMETEPAPPPRRTWDRRKVILDRNLFNVSTLVAQEPPPEPEEDLEATKLPLQLLGTVAHSDPGLAWAAVQDLKNRTHEVVRVDDQLLGARVLSIERRRIVLENEGRREELALDAEEPANGKRGFGAFAGRRRPATTARTTPRSTPEALRERIAKLREAGRVAPLPKAEPEPEEETPPRTPASLFSQARLLPKYEEGEMVGVQVSAIREGSLFEQIGLADGDTITELNGIQVTNPQESSNVLRELSEAQDFTVVVMGADGQERTITYSLEE